MSERNTETGIVESIRWVDDHMRIIDQTLLPEREVYRDISEAGQVWEAIRSLRVRGAPAIGIAAAYGVYLGVRALRENEIQNVSSEIDRICEYLASSRPTAVNLQWALDRASQTASRLRDKPLSEISRALLDLAKSIHEEDKQICAQIGKEGQPLVSHHAGILTHCNTGSLATGKYGTALSIIYHAHLNGKRIHVWVDETRPLLQGGRLTSWELQKSGIDHHLIADSMAGWVMKQNKVDLVLVGTDRVARNGDAANKIGTYALAVLAAHHDIPFYVAAPLSSIDMNMSSGEHIPIEERGADELRKIGRHTIAPPDTPVYNPAFDVTPHELITAFVTEKGIVKPGFSKNLASVVRS